MIGLYILSTGLTSFGSFVRFVSHTHVSVQAQVSYLGNSM